MARMTRMARVARMARTVARMARWLADLADPFASPDTPRRWSRSANIKDLFTGREGYPSFSRSISLAVYCLFTIASGLP